jgi:hypothetical protein
MKTNSMHLRPAFARRSAALILIGLASGGCSSVEIRKVPQRTDYANLGPGGASAWSLERQEQADAIRGVRFYMPRPYLDVYESFPIHTDIYLASAELVDGKYLRMRDVKPLTGGAPLDLEGLGVGVGGLVPLDRVARTDEFDWSIRVGQAPANSSGAESFAPQGRSTAGTPADRDGDPKRGGKPSEAEGGEGTPRDKEAPATQPASPQVGRSEIKVSSEPLAFIHQPLRGNFDLVYLPDFSEQYAVEVKQRFGNANADVRLGQGWSLLGMEGQVDNSAVLAPLIDLYKTAISLAKTVATQGLDLPAGSEMLFRPQGRSLGNGAADFLRAAEQSGGWVTLRIVVVHYAAKGLYPLLKPAELAAAATGTQPGIAATASVPVAFRTFRYIGVEAVGLSNPFGDLYDKTGTRGDSGLVRIDGSAKPQQDPTPQDPTQAELAQAAAAKLKSSGLLNELAPEMPSGHVLKQAEPSVAKESLRLELDVDPDLSDAQVKETVDKVRAALGKLASNMKLELPKSVEIGIDGRP